jgi:hypothetical protein
VFNKLTAFLSQGTCLPDAPFCSPAVLKREAELVNQDASLTPCQREQGRCIDLQSLKAAETRKRTARAIKNDDRGLLAALLREAADAHHNYEAQTGVIDEDWPSWYASYLLGGVS